jgi:lysozyme
MISDKGIALIIRFEGLELKAYPDPGTGGEPITLGCGHTGGIKLGDTCTEAEAMQWLREDCAEAEACIDSCVEPELTQNQRDALISLIYNIGCGNFKGSTMLRLLNAGNLNAAAGQFKRWNHAGHKEMPGLTKRRKAEADLFMEA